MVITYMYLLILITGLILTSFVALLDSTSFAAKSATKFWHPVLIILLLGCIVYLCIANFPVTLTLLVLVTGFIVLLDVIFWGKKRKASEKKPGTIVRNSREFFPVLLLVWIIRSFIVQPYHVPTGSLEPTVMPGDFIAVKQYPYGLRFPIGNFTLMKTSEPKRGEIVLFYYPVNPQMVFVKRLIGMPGDHIVYKNKVLSVNGKEAKQKMLGMAQDNEPGQDAIPVYRIEEDLLGVKHEIFVQLQGGQTDNFDLIVPPGMYFMMGDNRDDSDDSRIWGFVPERNLIGQAWLTLLGWDADTHRLSWTRSGKAIQ